MGLELSMVILVSMILIGFYIVFGISVVTLLCEDTAKNTIRRRLIKTTVLLFWPAAIFIAILVGAYRTIVD